MKKSLLLAAFALFAQLGMGQVALKEKQVPSDIVTDFKLRFHEASEVTWYKQAETHYAAHFLVRDAKGECIYSATDGQWVQSEQEITFRELPDSAKGHLQAHFSEYTAKLITKVTTRRYGVLYDAHVTNGVKQYCITYDMDGDLVDKKEEKLPEPKPEEKSAEGEKKKGLSLPKLGGN